VTAVSTGRRHGLVGSARYASEPVPGTAVAGLLADLARRARREVLTFHPHGGRDPADAFHAVTHGQLQRKVNARIVCTTSALQDHALRASLQELTSAGARVRVAEGTLHRLVLVDGVIAVVSLERSASWGNAVVVRERPIVAGLQALFHSTWQQSRPFAERYAQPDEPGGGPCERDVRVLTMMSSGVADARAAQTIGVSTRTYRRYVADLMRRLGARSRFQAGIHAAERGWV
jgi:DNA-binding NarL/FixJ family response regulator